MYTCEVCAKKYHYQPAFFNTQEICHGCYSPEQKEALRVADSEESKSLLKGHGWPYGANIDAGVRVGLVEWAHRMNLVQSGHRFYPYKSGQGKVLWSALQESSNLFDHLSLWRSPSSRRVDLIFSQPYNFEGGEEYFLEGAMTWAREEEYPCVVLVGKEPSWYGRYTRPIYVWNPVEFSKREHLFDTSKYLTSF